MLRLAHKVAIIAISVSRLAEIAVLAPFRIDCHLLASIAGS